MKRILFAVALVSVVSFGAHAADWNKGTVLESTLDIQHVDLRKLPDGGCAVQAWANMTQSDGGFILSEQATSAFTDVSGVNRTDCLNIIDVRAKALFKIGRF